jgi:hypothetical protein
MKALDKRLGPLKLWQWGLIGGGTVLAYYLYEKDKEAKAEVNPEEEEKLLGALDKGAGGGGSGGSEGNTTSTGTPVPAAEGPKGQEGMAGPAGIAGPAGEAPSAELEAKVSALEEDQVKNNPATSSHNGAPQALPKGEFRNNGAIERTFTKGNGIFHQYLSGPKKGTVFRVGTVHKPKAKTKRVKKPTPVHKKVVAKKPPPKKAHVKKKEPVHR